MLCLSRDSGVLVLARRCQSQLCEIHVQVVVNNLDAILMEAAARAALTAMLESAPELLAEIEARHQERLSAERAGADAVGGWTTPSHGIAGC